MKEEWRITFTAFSKALESCETCQRGITDHVRKGPQTSVWGPFLEFENVNDRKKKEKKNPIREGKTFKFTSSGDW